MALAAGEKLGPYEILSPIGKGGMGEVYRARDTKLGRDVAIKVLPEAFARDPERMARFEREAKVLASLNHPHIAQIYGLESGALVMELVEGDTLSQIAKRGPLPVPEALRLAEQIADALGAAHDKGIAHRDLKPGNIMVTAAGAVKVLDFGLAAVAASGDSGNPETSPTLTISPTRAGMILGTAAYMAPEQARGKPVDRRADIWAFGVVLYEMLTGRQLFQGETISDVLAGVLAKEPDLSAVPAEMRRLVSKCLEKDPRRRLRDIEDWRLALEEEKEAVAPAKPRAAWPYWAAIGALALAALAFAGLWLRPAPLPEVVRFQIHAPPGSTLPLGTPAISPDGRTIAYTVTDPDGMTRIHLRPIDRVDTRILPGTEGAVHPFWSPDGHSLAFGTADFHLKRIDVDGGAPLDLTALGGPWHGAWSRNGDILFNLAGVISRIPAQGGPVDQVLSSGAGHPFFLPDGKRFLVWTQQGQKNSIQLATLGSRNLAMVLDNVDSAPILAPTPRGNTYLLYLRGNDLFAQDFDLRAGAVRGNPMRVVSNIGRVAAPAVRAAVGVSTSGVLAYQTGGAAESGQLTWFDRSGKQAGSLPADASGSHVQLSPDGLSVAMTRTDTSGNTDVWVTDLSRKSSTRLTFDPGLDSFPVWSPDGKQLALVNAGNSPGIHIMEVNDSAKSRNFGVLLGPLSWSPDGKYLLGRSLAGKLALVPLTGSGKPIPVGSRNGNSPDGRISPDGKYIAFTSDQSGRNEIYVQPMPPGTGEEKVSIDGGSAPRWRKDGKELFFVSATDAMMAADVKPGATFSTGIPHQLFQVKGVDLTDYDVRPDGQQFLVYVPQGGAGQDFPITVVLNWWAELGKK